MVDDESNHSVFELKVAGLRLGGTATAVIFGVIAFTVVSLLTFGNYLLGCVGGIAAGIFALKIIELKVDKMHSPLDYPPPKLYRLEDRAALSAIYETFERNAFIDPIKNMPRDWRIKTYPDKGEIIASVEYEEKFGINFQYKEANIREEIQPRHLKVIFTCKQESAGTSVRQEWEVHSPKTRDYANQFIRSMGELVDEALIERQRGIADT